ncbi:RagB/SusD family nutrient uptake outer membrane protein [Cyclobacterium sp.]|uniref:RagB/SusD family nutrient uptake outer membrane protein n=1 Tax=Cyclobacterium sp. TaxID=1966343 RepID=UPI001999EB89|nr:RagB/SusD family nutrient uptake outer membrane protein [Cyclobacterium sp.]MBD3631126.1 RagB/SusD family nutrient uptake outer membrane protein [Cyclobacterium sp.]
MKNTHKLRIYIIILLIIPLKGCNDLLEEDPPSNISLANFYQSEEDALVGLYGAYSNLYGLVSQEPNYGEMIADDMTISPIVPDAFEWDEFNFNSEVTSGLWSQCYSAINRANEVILYTEGIDFESGRKAALIAEARALRAIYYFHLARAMGGVPLYDSPTVGFDNIYEPRSTEEVVFNFIIEDLKEAADKLGATSPAGRINADIANALLARIYLYRGDFQNALSHAETVINSNRYRLLDDYADLFKPENDNSPEHIFQIQYLSGETNNPLPGRYGPRAPSGPYGNSFWAGTTIPGSYAPSAEFVSQNPESYRRSVTIADQYEHIDGVSGTITMQEVYGGSFPYYISKFDDREGELQSGVNYTIIRYADILLIAAEALNEIDPDNPKKYEWINRVRERARNGVESDLPDLSSMTQDQFRTAVMEERRFELAFENQRAWDLKRRNLFLEKMRAQGKNVEDFMTLFPIPDLQTQLNSNLEQNPGW